MAIQNELFAVREKVLSLLDGVTENELNYHMDETTWSMAQVLEHVTIVERGVIRLIPMGLKQPPTYEERALPLEKWIPNRSKKVMAAEAFHPSKDPKSVAGILDLLESVRERLLLVIEEIDDESLLAQTSPPIPHPVFGELSTRQWLQTVPYHEARHIGQIEELRKAYKEHKKSALN